MRLRSGAQGTYTLALTAGLPGLNSLINKTSNITIGIGNGNGQRQKERKRERKREYGIIN